MTKDIDKILKRFVLCFVLQKYFKTVSDPPGKPGKPAIEDADENSVTLSWSKPKDDGGDRIKGYVVEAKEKGSNKWKPLNAKHPCRDTQFIGKLSHEIYVILNIISDYCDLSCDGNHVSTSVNLRKSLSLVFNIFS